MRLLLVLLMLVGVEVEVPRCISTSDTSAVFVVRGTGNEGVPLADDT